MISSTGQSKGAIRIGLALLLILAFALLGNLYWVQHNLVLVGHDASAYLETTVEYANLLTVLSPQTLFKAFTISPYRTPALFIVVQPFYWLFGNNMHSAQGVNLLFLLVVIGLTFVLGKTSAGEQVGLFAALLVGLLPMMWAMARLFYTEMLLTAMVALNLLALYRCQGFTQRRWSLLWGTSLGVGLLVKWTMPIYVALPVAWVLWQAKLWQANLIGLTQLRFNVRVAIGALLIALLVSTLWFWPNRSEAQTFLLGNFLYVGWVILVWLFVYAWLQPAKPVANSWAALFLGILIASLWYLPHANFASLLLYEDQVRGQTSASPLNLANYLRYFPYLLHDHFGLLAFWLIVPAAGLPWLWAWVKRKALYPSTVLLWLSMLSAYLVLSLLAQRNPRNLVPLLPGVAVLATLALQQYPRPIRLTLGASWLVVLLVQWGMFTFDSWSPFLVQTRAFWVVSDYVLPPASQETDPGYWIGPALLKRVGEDQGNTQSLGMLVNTHQVHPGIVNYLIALAHKNITVTDLSSDEHGNWANLLASQWILLKNGDNGNVDPSGQGLHQRIMAGDPLFTALYTQVAQYPLPNGDIVSLYHRAQGPGHPAAEPNLLKQSQAVAAAIRSAWSSHASLVYATGDLAVWVGMHDPSRARVQVLPADRKLAEKNLSDLNDTLLVVLNHEESKLEAWLDQHAYRTIEIGDDFAAVAIYGRPPAPLQNFPTHAAWQDMHLSTVKTYAHIAPGQVLPLETKVEGGMNATAKMSVRLLARDGAIVASHDRPVLAADRFGLFVPPTTPPGVYQLVMLVYQPESGAPFANQLGKDTTPLLTVNVQP